MAGNMRTARATDAGREWFAELLPEESDVTRRPMFGNLGGFVNGNLFLALYGDDVAVRLSPEDRAELLADGGVPFAPMPERPMKEYVVLPHRGDVGAAAPWVARALSFARELPPKEKKAKKK